VSEGVRGQNSGGAAPFRFHNRFYRLVLRSYMNIVTEEHGSAVRGRGRAADAP